MGLLDPYIDPTGKLAPYDIDSKNIQNIITELNRSQDQLDSLNKVFAIATILNVSHTVTSNDITNQPIFFSYPHGLSFAPQIIGSMINTKDSVRRILPVYWLSNQSYYQASTIPSVSIIVTNTDTTNVNIRIDIYDALGLSWIVSNYILTFKLYCLQESIIVGS